MRRHTLLFRWIFEFMFFFSWVQREDQTKLLQKIIVFVNIVIVIGSSGRNKQHGCRRFKMPFVSSSPLCSRRWHTQICLFLCVIHFTKYSRTLRYVNFITNNLHLHIGWCYSSDWPLHGSWGIYLWGQHHPHHPYQW